jgi:hypothetical protein
MSKNQLLVLHGMGQHTAESFKKEVYDSLQSALQFYPSLKNHDLESSTDIIGVGYNHIFDQQRSRMAETARDIKTRLGEVEGMSDNIIQDVFSDIQNVELGIDDDDFFNTHFVDVLMYRFTPLGERVRVEVAKQIAKAVATVNGGSQNVHILAHSLGTSVVHDTLAKLYTASWNDDSKRLSVRMHKLGSLHMLANTSRVLESFVNVSQSVVRPDKLGCTSLYREYRHQYDPITWARAFNPTDNGNWISNERWHLGFYQLKVLSAITSEHGHTHDIKHYIQNPLVHLKLFSEVFGIQLTQDEIEVGHQAYIDTTLAEVATDLQESIDDLKALNLENILGLLTSAQALKSFIETAGGQF